MEQSAGLGFRLCFRLFVRRTLWAFLDFRIDLHPAAYFLEAFDNDAFTLGKALCDDPVRPIGVADLNLADLHGVIRLHDIHVVGSLNVVDRLLRDHQSAFVDADLRSHSRKLPRSQDVLGVGEASFNDDCSRERINFASKDERGPFLRPLFAASQVELEVGTRPD